MSEDCEREPITREEGRRTENRTYTSNLLKSGSVNIYPAEGNGRSSVRYDNKINLKSRPSKGGISR